MEKAAEEGSPQRGPRLTEAGEKKHQNGRPLVRTVGSQSCLHGRISPHPVVNRICRVIVGKCFTGSGKSLPVRHFSGKWRR